MKRVPIVAFLFVAVLTIGLVFVLQSQADANQTDLPGLNTPSQAQAPADLEAKRCSTSSDCPNSKCKSGQCGGCSTSSDCKYGKCKSSQCGGCSTSSDCGGWGKCNSGWCGGCSTSSDCGSFGSCRSGKCEKSPY